LGNLVRCESATGSCQANGGNLCLFANFERIKIVFPIFNDHRFFLIALSPSFRRHFESHPQLICISTLWALFHFPGTDVPVPFFSKNLPKPYKQNFFYHLFAPIFG
jgi:hypothetical protein